MERSTGIETASSPAWATLETYARTHIQALVQRLLEEEVDALLGRPKSERRGPEAPTGYRNGYGTPRRLALTNGTITVRRPRVRDLDARFESRVLPLFRRRSQEVGALLPELYLHGLATGDFERHRVRDGADRVNPSESNAYVAQAEARRRTRPRAPRPGRTGDLSRAAAARAARLRRATGRASVRSASRRVR